MVDKDQILLQKELEVKTYQEGSSNDALWFNYLYFRVTFRLYCPPSSQFLLCFTAMYLKARKHPMFLFSVSVHLVDRRACMLLHYSLIALDWPVGVIVGR